MAGIKANSTSVTMDDGDTATNQTQSGYITGEQITLSTTPTGSSYTWGQAIPSGSASARSGLSSTSGDTPTFTPDVGGEYVITADVDGTGYTLRLTVVQSIVATPVEAVRLMPREDSTVTAPSSGRVLYYSSTQGQLATKDSGGTVRTVDETSV